ncbi:MAG: metallophosphoesterase, partial [Candidatus Thermoplasmatota archaeon]|nr:metallophosphoesterase [Candidatus Thermoplasmatota archaeon]
PAVDEVHLVPSYGPGPSTVVAADQGAPEASSLWEGPYARTVVPVTFQLPEDLAPGLYDIVIPNVDKARRALAVYEAWPETPRIVLVADTQTGDPRALSDGFHGMTGIHPLAPHESHPEDLVLPPDPEPMNEALADTYGVDLYRMDIDPSKRWSAYRAAIEQINALAPDLVLFSGDLNFAQMVPGSYHVEYEESWALINGGEGVDGTPYEGFHAPTLLSPGNHDGYAANGEDGLAFWMAYFGPPAFRTTFSNITFVSINTYDWSELDRLGASYAVSAWGGQVRGEQMTWLRQALCEANGGEVHTDPPAPFGMTCLGQEDRRVITFAHHSPSWVQDDYRTGYGGVCAQAPCQGTPGVEQVTRGAISYTTTDQGWSGENRLELRDTLREFAVDLHAAGHTHRDRIARDLGEGTILEVPQEHREGLDVQALHLVTEDGQVSVPDQTWAFERMRDAPGPLYVETTTTASDTTSYFGYRPVTWHTSEQAFPDGALGIPPFEMGYPMTRELLDEIANDPDRWNPDHAELGLFSTPTFLPGPEGH